jgi:transcriptional regulator with XRE-family HTH domain
MTDKSFAADLEFLRMSVGLSLRELNRLTGIPRSTLGDALAGRRAPRLETVLAIVRACEADPGPWRHRWAHMSRRRRDSAVAPGSAEVLTPAQLPRDIAGFVGREPELARLRRAGIAVIHGQPGSGKTALAVHWAHSVAARYPDGQLFLNLRGHHATLGPVTPVEALGRMLGSLGVSFASPTTTQEPDEAAGLWRSTLAGRKVLIVLDDAISADQIQPLLPGAPGCTLIVTSRHHLADLVVHDGAESIPVGVLPAESSLSLLGHVAGSERVAAEPAAAAAVASACGHLPLALRLAGTLVGGTAHHTFAELARELLSTGDRLSALERLSRPSPVERSFEPSYRRLPRDAGRLFRSLGLHAGPSISVQEAALLGDLDPRAAHELLRTLAETHLIELDRSGRYLIPDLLHAYAARLTSPETLMRC